MINTLEDKPRPVVVEKDRASKLPLIPELRGDASYFYAPSGEILVAQSTQPTRVFWDAEKKEFAIRVRAGDYRGALASQARVALEYLQNEREETTIAMSNGRLTIEDGQVALAGKQRSMSAEVTTASNDSPLVTVVFLDEKENPASALSIKNGNFYVSEQGFVGIQRADRVVAHGKNSKDKLPLFVHDHIGILLARDAYLETDGIDFDFFPRKWSKAGQLLDEGYVDKMILSGAVNVNGYALLEEGDQPLTGSWNGFGSMHLDREKSEGYRRDLPGKRKRSVNHFKPVREKLLKKWEAERKAASPAPVWHLPESASVGPASAIVSVDVSRKPKSSLIRKGMRVFKRKQDAREAAQAIKTEVQFPSASLSRSEALPEVEQPLRRSRLAA